MNTNDWREYILPEARYDYRPMKQPTLFDSEHDQAVRDLIAQFEKQLATATTDFERRELKQAIESWKRSLEPVAQPTPKRRRA